MEKIKKWAVNLQDVIVSMAKQMKVTGSSSWSE